MIHLRLIVPAPLAGTVLDELDRTPGVVHIVRREGAASRPEGDLVECDVVREALNDLVERLQDTGLHHEGAITALPIEVALSDTAADAAAAVPGEGGDALVWEALESQARANSTITVSYLVLMVIAAIIAGVGILLDSAILVIGAMVVGPDYGPIAAVCVGLVRRRAQKTLAAATAAAVGLFAAAAGALVATVLFRLTEIAPDAYDVGDRQLTAFIAHPDAMAAVVAVLAGVVGMLALTQGRSGVLVGVLVSVTTIPALANVGVATAYGAWDEVGGAALQLALNVAGLLIAGTLTLAVQSRFTTGGTSRPGRWSPRARAAPGVRPGAATSGSRSDPRR